jgi:signal transduction histidine kinase
VRAAGEVVGMTHETSTSGSGDGTGFELRRPVSRGFLRLPDWLTKVAPDAGQEEARVRTVERDLGLPVRVAVLALLAFHFFHSEWFGEAELLKEGVHQVVRWTFLIYVGLNLVAGVVLAGMADVPFKVVRQVVLGMVVVDAVWVGSLTAVTGGYDSLLFWVFVCLVVRNALSQPDAGRQILMNLLTTGCYVVGGGMELVLTELEMGMLDPLTLQAVYPEGMEGPTESVILRVTLLLLMTACCYGVEVLFDRHRRMEEEAQEFAQRQHQLESAGRLAAEIAHQLKNPLGIINNAAFTLQRTVKEGKTITQQIQIIREEVARSDRIITELMGYARLVEGRVERLDVVEELEQAIRQVFPPAVHYDVQIERNYTPALPALLAQRSHIAEVFVNLLQNAREAMQGRGRLRVGTAVGENFSIIVTVADDGPGIAPEHQARVFEAYYTTREQGTGLGLAIVKHNTELYGGRVRLESELGKGARFVLEFPARTLMRLRR